MGIRLDAPEPDEQRARVLPVKTCLTCSWLHLLKSWSLLKTRGGSKLAQALSKPRTEAENHRRWLRREVFPQVKNFYRHYLDEEPAREPFYGNSSRR